MMCRSSIIAWSPIQPKKHDNRNSSGGGDRKGGGGWTKFEKEGGVGNIGGGSS